VTIRIPRPVLILAAGLIVIYLLARLAAPAPACRPEDFPCPSDSLTLTASMATAFAATPSNTPPAGVTVVPIAGDLGWGAVYGVIADGLTNLPIEDATVRCRQTSYTSPAPCDAVTTTNSEGVYSFSPVFFHDTDRITLIVEAPGYIPLEFKQEWFAQPEFHADLGLFPVDGATATPTPAGSATPTAYMSTP
jgi:hypothetical protein